MCQYCEEKGLPCLLCGAATMRHQFDRGRCGGCATANRPPREWPVFRFCPYCGRELGIKTSEETEEEKQEDKEMGKYTWTGEADKAIFEMITVGASVADICDRMGCTDTQLKNHVAVLRRKDPSFPTLCGEVSGKERFALDEDPTDARPPEHEAGEKKASLNPLEQEMADIIAENNATIEGLREELAVEKAARAEEAAAFQREINKLTAQRDGLQGVADGYVAELHEKDESLKKAYGDLEQTRKARDEALEELEQLKSGAIRRTKEAEENRVDLLRDAHCQLREMMDHVMELKGEVHERDELIVAMAKAIFLDEREVLHA